MLKLSMSLKLKTQNLKFAIAASAFFFALVATAAAQEATKIPRVAYLDGATLSAPRTDAFRQGLRELGYIDGKNIRIEWKSAEGNVDRLPLLAAELVRLNTAVIVSAGAT